MLDDNLDQIQSDLDMQLINQMQIQRDLQNMRGGPTPEEIEANKAANCILAVIFAMIVGGLALLYWFMS